MLKTHEQDKFLRTGLRLEANRLPVYQ